MLAALAVLALLAGAPLANAAGAAADPASPRLVVVGAPGLAWSDLDGGDLPALGAMTGEGALGSMTVRAVGSSSCAVDGWLTLSAGRRAGDVAGPCRVPPPVVDGQVPALGRVPRGRGRRVVRRPAGHAGAGGHGIRRLRRDRGCRRRDRRREPRR